MTEDESKKIRVELDHEQKVIHLDCFFYDLKGVLIAEATEEDKKGRSIYCEHKDMKDSAKRRDWMAFYRSFVNQICPVLRYYVKLEEI